MWPPQLKETIGTVKTRRVNSEKGRTCPLQRPIWKYEIEEIAVLSAKKKE